MLKYILVLLFLALAVSGQIVQQPPQSRRHGQDPIGDYRLQVRGFIANQEKTLGTVEGFAERLKLADEGTTLCHSILSVKPGGQVQSQQTGNQQLGRMPKGPLLHIFATETQDSLQYFVNPAQSMTEVGECYFASLESEADNLEFGQWTQQQQPCGRNQEGSLWTRTISFTDSNNRNVEKTEAVCKSQDKILWVEMGDSIDGNLNFVLHMDVVDQGEQPQADQQGIASFSIPAICVIRPQEVESAADLLTDVFSDLGIELPSSGLGRRGGIREERRDLRGERRADRQERRADRQGARQERRADRSGVLRGALLEEANIPSDRFDENVGFGRERVRSQATGRDIYGSPDMKHKLKGGKYGSAMKDKLKHRTDEGLYGSMGGRWEKEEMENLADITKPKHSGRGNIY